jgi:integrase/recombinase XerD
VKRDDSGDGLRMLQEHLGHQSIATTMQYRKVAGEDLVRQAVGDRKWLRH